MKEFTDTCISRNIKEIPHLHLSRSSYSSPHSAHIYSSCQSHPHYRLHRPHHHLIPNPPNPPNPPKSPPPKPLNNSELMPAQPQLVPEQPEQKPETVPSRTTNRVRGVVAEDNNVTMPAQPKLAPEKTEPDPEPVPPAPTIKVRGVVVEDLKTFLENKRLERLKSKNKNKKLETKRRGT